ncbi:MarR family winged helix-turn-helix transcriptional regulator [Pseudopedobacter sp.]|uniref:MarR family winged helix-turn-helix transcriptional regulator n=1 Tax=Pseudopedobacter sp. TaxID=1936787 RepID=UPI0033405D54
MNYKLLKDVVQLVEEFEHDNTLSHYSPTIDGFKRWIAARESLTQIEEPDWEGKDKGRSAESVINTLIVHMNRYAKSYSKSAIYGSDFSTQEEFIFLINLKAFGAMSKMELIKKNIQEKPVGIQTINRLIKQGWITETGSEKDKRSKIISITDKGLEALEQQMLHIRKATEIVTGNLNRNEKMQLITLLQKLDHFHQPIYAKNLEPAQLIDMAYQQYLEKKN